MALPLKESRAVRELADLLYDFLPGSGNSAWKGHVSADGAIGGALDRRRTSICSRG